MKLLLSNNVQLKKGVWTPEEDETLVAYIKSNGIKNWTNMSKDSGLARSAKSCRLRWMNYLRPELKGGRLTEDEIKTVIKLQESLGNKWSDIAAQLPGRTDNEIKNFWHTYTRKKGSKMVKQCKDKQPKLDTPSSNDGVKETESGSSVVSTEYNIIESYSPTFEPITNSPIPIACSSDMNDSLHDIYILKINDWPSTTDSSITTASSSDMNDSLHDVYNPEINDWPSTTFSPFTTASSFSPYDVYIPELDGPTIEEEIVLGYPIYQDDHSTQANNNNDVMFTDSPITTASSSEFLHDVYIPEFIDWPIIEEERILGCPWPF